MTFQLYTQLPASFKEIKNGTESGDWLVAAGTMPAEIHGKGGNDFLLGTETFGDTLYGDGGNDRLWGYGNNDLLVGGDGIDTLNGGDGNDTIIGGWERDIVFGGPGRDLFDFDPYNDVNGHGFEEFRDFEPGQDRLRLHGQMFLPYHVEFVNSFVPASSGLALFFETSTNNLVLRAGDQGFVLAHFNTTILPSDIEWVDSTQV
jgi:Ca2+-binding RTX toxin-like protein